MHPRIKRRFHQRRLHSIAITLPMAIAYGVSALRLGEITRAPRSLLWPGRLLAKVFAVAIFLVAAFFVHRSIYGMRIQVQEPTGVHRPVAVRA